jgi:tetratricopeptide (TPR) repeat protein
LIEIRREKEEMHRAITRLTIRTTKNAFVRHSTLSHHQHYNPFCLVTNQQQHKFILHHQQQERSFHKHLIYYYQQQQNHLLEEEELLEEEDENIQYAKHILHNAKDFLDFQTHIEQSLNEQNFGRVLALLDVLSPLIFEPDETISPASTEEHKNNLLWKVYVLKHYSFSFWHMGMIEEALKNASSLLALEKQCIQYEILDEVFDDLNYAMITKAVVAVQRGEHLVAIKLYTFVIESRIKKRLKRTLDPVVKLRLKQDLNQLLEDRGKSYLHLFKLEEAIKDFSEVITKSEKNSNVLGLRAHAYLLQSDLSAAEKDALQSMSQSITHVAVEAFVAVQIRRVEMQEKTWEEAIDSLSEYIRNYPLEPSLYAGRAIAYVAVMEYEKALADCQIEEQLDINSTLLSFDTYSTVLSRLLKLTEMKDLVTRMHNYVKQLPIVEPAVITKWEANVFIIDQDIKRYNGLYEEALELADEIGRRVNFSIGDKLYYSLLLSILDRGQEALEIVTECSKMEFDPFHSDALSSCLLSVTRALASSSCEHYANVDEDIKYLKTELERFKLVYPMEEWDKYKMEMVGRLDLIAGMATIRHDLNTARTFLEESVYLMKKSRYQEYLHDALAYLSLTETKLDMKKEAEIHKMECLKLCPNHKRYSILLNASH